MTNGIITQPAAPAHRTGCPRSTMWIWRTVAKLANNSAAITEEKLARVTWPTFKLMLSGEETVDRTWMTPPSNCGAPSVGRIRYCGELPLLDIMPMEPAGSLRWQSRQVPGKSGRTSVLPHFLIYQSGAMTFD